MEGLSGGKRGETWRQGRTRGQREGLVGRGAEGMRGGERGLRTGGMGDRRYLGGGGTKANWATESRWGAPRERMG